VRGAAILVLVFGLGLLGGLGLLAEHAGADLLPTATVPTATVPSVTVPVPPVTTVTTPAVTTPTVTTPPVAPPPTTVSTPSVTVPSVTTPPVSPPRVTTPIATTATPSVPSVTTPQVSVPGATSVVGTASSPQGGGSTTGAGTGGATGGGTGGGPAAGSGSSSTGGGGALSSPSGTVAGSSAGAYGAVAGPTARSAVSRLHASRTWIGTKGSKQRRGTTLTFVMRHRAKVIFTVQELSPVCRTVGRFVVQARKGRNKVHFTGRVRGRKLAPGTYFLEARTASGRLVRGVTLVVVTGSAPSRGELRALRTANVCAATTSSASTSPFVTSPFFTGTFGVGSTGAHSVSGPAAPNANTQSSGLGAGSSSTGRILASAVERTARAIQPVLVALLAISILLLGLASLPQAAIAEARLNYVLARHRTELAAFGAAALVAVVIAFLIA
jgi:hypothetical protein